MREVYLDNAATSYPKPPSVRAALMHFMDEIHASAGRGAYAEARRAGEILDHARTSLATLLRVSAPERILFTLNCSDALNLALKGVLRSKDRVVTSDMEHNSILRPLAALEERLGISVVRVPANSEGLICMDSLAAALREPTRLVAMQHASNVSGTLQPIAAMAQLTREAGALFLLDAAQTMGALPLHPEALGIDLLAFPGHKCLLGPLGTGGLWVSPNLDLATVREGGTGSRSEEAVQPAFWPDRHEAGSHNLLGLAGLAASVNWILAQGLESLAQQKQVLVSRFLGHLATIENVRGVGPKKPEARTGVFSCVVGRHAPESAGRMLDDLHGVKVRSGLHCAPFAHRALGTFPHGTVRLSIGPFTTNEDLDHAAQALADVARRPQA
jgi:cysteine desulfurase family protein